jgi:hypothetical protein
MRISLQGEVNSFNEGIEILEHVLGFEICEEGIPVIVEMRSGNIEVGFEKGKGFIRAECKIHFFRALGLFLEHIKDNNEWEFVFKMPAKLCSVLSIKSTLGVEIKKLYDMKDMEALKVIVQEKLPELYNRVNDLRLAHREQWFYTYKPFGWEIIDIRYGGLLARVNTAIHRITQYVNGDIKKLEELEEERMYFDLGDMSMEQGFGSCNQYHRIISVSPIG